LAGYGMFRFDSEEMLSGELEPVVYCYELQVTKFAQRTGLGSALMNDMETLARVWDMHKVMLTCFLGTSSSIPKTPAIDSSARIANTSALAFYKSIGYADCSR
jgi:GNAT superfamily N-acetyltransferase